MIFAAALLAATVSAQAQNEYKPSQGQVTTEFALSFKGSDALVGLKDGNLRGRYFLKDDLALRAGLGFGVNSVKDGMKDNSFNVGVGLEKHFTGTERLSPYVGAEVGYGYQYQKSSPSAAKADANSFKAALLVGADYYILPKVYVGLEGGYGLDTNSISEGAKTTKLSTGAQASVKVGFTF